MFILGDVFLGVQNGNFGTALQLARPGSISAIDANTGQRLGPRRPSPSAAV
jgi:hypothetical protein